MALDIPHFGTENDQNHDIRNSQHFLRILRAVSNDMERCHLFVTFVAGHHILGIVCANRIRFAIGCGDSADGHFDIDQYVGTDVVVEYIIECGLSRQFSCGSYRFLHSAMNGTDQTNDKLTQSTRALASAWNLFLTLCEHFARNREQMKSAQVELCPCLARVFCPA